MSRWCGTHGKIENSARHPSRMLESRRPHGPWHYLLRRCSAVEVFELLRFQPLRRLRIGIIVWPSCRGTTRFLSRDVVLKGRIVSNVQALFHAALGQQLQGPPCARSAQRSEEHTSE